jgi:hypothetical protein
MLLYRDSPRLQTFVQFTHRFVGWGLFSVGGSAAGKCQMLGLDPFCIALVSLLIALVMYLDRSFSGFKLHIFINERCVLTVQKS